MPTINCQFHPTKSLFTTALNGSEMHFSFKVMAGGQDSVTWLIHFFGPPSLFLAKKSRQRSKTTNRETSRRHSGQKEKGINKMGGFHENESAESHLAQVWLSRFLTQTPHR